MTSQNQCCGSKYIEFGSGSRSGSGFIVMLSILKEKVINNFKEKQFSLLSVFFRNKMSPKEIFSQLRHELLILNLPDLYSEYGSGSTKLLNTDPILD